MMLCWTHSMVLFLLLVVVYGRGSKNNHGHSSSKKIHSLPPSSVSDIGVPPWIQSYCRKAGCEFYSEIPSSFIRDPVTTATVCDSLDSPYVDAAIRLINGDVNSNTHNSSPYLPSKRESHEINAVAEHLYDLLHGRYIITYEGLRSVRMKYEQVKCFCPKCRDIYNPTSIRHRKIDGAAFGTTLPHLLLQRMPELCPVQPKDRYVPRIFGFELHETSTELQIYQGITTAGNEQNHDDRIISFRNEKEEKKRNLVMEMDRLNEMEEEREQDVDDDEHEEEDDFEEEEDVEADVAHEQVTEKEEKGVSEGDMDSSDLDEND